VKYPFSWNVNPPEDDDVPGWAYTLFALLVVLSFLAFATVA
jgi:hypothetical protein